jgi:fatty acid/phospholipid biosynthesis enzyme
LVHGLLRLVLAVPLPAPRGSLLLIDAGGHAQGATVHLAQAAALAHAYLKVTKNLQQPRIGLLNNGLEHAAVSPEVAQNLRQYFQ